jgi:hypothetical protein
MFAPSMATLAAVLATIRLTSATCTIPNGLKPDAPKETWPESVCVAQAEGNYHLSYSSSSLCVPTLSGGSPLAGCSGKDGFKLFDWNCQLLGTYDRLFDNGCGAPYEIDYFPGKPITIRDVFLDEARPRFTFNYDGRDYKTDGDGFCSQRFTEAGLRAVAECRVGFAGPPPCTLQNIRDSPSSSVTTDDEALCTVQAPGNVQVTMETSDPSTVSFYDSECRLTAFFRREHAPEYCPWPIKIDALGEGRQILITKWDANQHVFAFDFRGRTYEGEFMKTKNEVEAGLGEYASKSGIYVL